MSHDSFATLACFDDAYPYTHTRCDAFLTFHFMCFFPPAAPHNVGVGNLRRQERLRLYEHGITRCMNGAGSATYISLLFSFSFHLVSSFFPKRSGKRCRASGSALLARCLLLARVICIQKNGVEGLQFGLDGATGWVGWLLHS